jgi:hypothetical protein
MKAVIRATHRTMIFESRESAIKFLEETKQWKVEEWTLADEAEYEKKIKERFTDDAVRK